VKLFSQNTKIEALKRVPLFSGLSKKELVLLAKAAEDIELDQGYVLCKEGRSGSEFFAIVEGQATVSRKGRKRDSFGPGDFFGEIALISDVPRTATVVAATPIRVFVLTRQSFRSLLIDSPVVQEKVMAALAERLAAVKADAAL
jgi:CRP-like cAMP-binding protein